MPIPLRGADLKQFVCALNWMRSAIPQFSTLIYTLHDLLELVYARDNGRRTKTAAAKIPLSEVGWTALHAAAFSACKTAFEIAVVLAHPSEEKRLCLYTDASDQFWSAVVTQVL
jgi:RNase H-like domain found in reverse transcriptase